MNYKSTLHSSHLVLKLVVGLLLWSIGFIPVSEVLAFKPGKPVNAGDHTHPTMTEQAYKKLVFDQYNLTEFDINMRLAMTEIIVGNQSNDWSPTFLFEKYHFDAEQFADSQRIVNNFFTSALEDMGKPIPLVVTNGDLFAVSRVTSARRRIGRALHAIQDFYSHSNWVELGWKFPHPAVGVLGMQIPNVSSPGNSTCYGCSIPLCAACENNISTNALTR